MSVKNKSATQDWFYHSPHQKIKGDIVIPVTSQVFEEEGSPLANEYNSKRGWIRDTDTDYIKLAKTGGRKDLFQYRTHKCKEEEGPVLYPRCDWFDHERPSEQDDNCLKSSAYNMPEWYIHEEFASSSVDPVPQTKASRPLVGFDHLTVWQRQDENSTTMMLPAIKAFKQRNNKTSKRTNETIKFPKIYPRGGRKVSTTDGEIGSILTYAYEKEFLEDTKERNVKLEMLIINDKKEQLERHEKEREIWRKKALTKVSTNKPMFKLTKFSNISSRIDSRR